MGMRIGIGIRRWASGEEKTTARARGAQGWREEKEPLPSAPEMGPLAGHALSDFPSDALGKAIPYGVFDMTRNEASVSVGRDHDTPAFAVASIRHWWRTMGKRSYPHATDLLITADAGGSNGYRARAWKARLQDLADETGLRIHVCHFPPGTSKWNKIEHRLFRHITRNWRGRPLATYETVVELIGSTRTSKGLHVKARLDDEAYPTGVEITKTEMKNLALHKDSFHGDWNYRVEPRRS
jgi:hypothetical protein